MKTKSLYALALALLFAIASSPLYAAEMARVESFEGNLTGKIVCLYEWETDESYVGSGRVCTNPRHNQRSLVTESGDIYLLVPADEADEFVIKALSTEVAERKDVVVEGEIVKGPVNIVKVRTLKVK